MTTRPAAEKGYRKHAWILILVVFGFWLFRGVAGLLGGGSLFSIGLKNLTGMDWNQIVSAQPGFATFINGSLIESSFFLIGFSLLGMAIARTSYRKGERWAWYVCWYLPLWYVSSIYLVATNAEGAGATAPFLYFFYLLLMIVTLLGLLLPYRKFFPRKQV
ncbi:MAG: hypothetical protein LYZ66_05345 [Nitrososphaerales archaeon]|nr:hypothetical protein [Nitrososphaerales archaeon]